jgi:hypothetical protein
VDSPIVSDLLSLILRISLRELLFCFLQNSQVGE